MVKGIDKDIKKQIEEGKVFLSDISPVKNAEIEEAFLKSLCKSSSTCYDNNNNNNKIFHHHFNDKKKDYSNENSSEEININIEENYDRS